MNRKRYVLIVICLLGLANLPVHLQSPAPWKEEPTEEMSSAWEQVCQKVIRDSTLYHEGWDTLAQTRFWRLVMQLDPELSVVNVAKTREILGTTSTLSFDQLSRRGQNAFKDSVRKSYSLPRDEEIYITSGKNHFYHFGKVIPSINQAIEVFAEEGVDPWYAQTILLIESPGKLQLSTAGAYGPFQLMKAVAQEYGLTVNEEQDDRKDFHKSAQGAARLIRRMCLPKTRSMLEELDIPYQETDSWFRLLVLHVYHAGPRNVRAVLRKIKPKEGGMALIQTMWQTEHRRFGNASQNYSQIALASMFELHELSAADPGTICPIAP